MTVPGVPPPLDIPALRARLEQRFRVYDVQSDEHVVAFYIDAPKDTLEAQFEELKAELRADGLVPILKYQDRGKINEARLGIPQNETCAVITEPLWKIEAPLLQLIECWPGAELAQHKHRRHIQRTTERFA